MVVTLFAVGHYTDALVLEGRALVTSDIASDVPASKCDTVAQ